MKYLDKTQLLLENEELFQATLGEFAENNYKQASTNEIIKKSKINRGSFYYRFNNKEELFIALIDHIFVEQIALFNKRKINLLTEKSLENIIFELFYNLYELYNFDNNYYKVIINHLQDSDSLLLIDKSTIEPLKHRIFKVLEQFTNIDKFEYIKIIINSVYHQFPKFLLNSYNVEDELKSFVNFILSTDEKKNILDNHTNINLKDIEFNDEITYFLSPVKNINVNINDRYTSINDAFVNYKETNKSLFSLVGISILSFKSTVLKLVRKSLKDVRYLLGFLNLEILEYLEKNYIFKRLIMTSLLFTVKEEPNISINLSEIPLNEKEKHLFLSLILPILSKTSKILIIDTSFKTKTLIDTFYILDEGLNIKRINTLIVQKILDNQIEIQYLDSNVVNYYYQSLDDFIINGLNKSIDFNNIISINTIKDISYDSYLRKEAEYVKYQKNSKT